MKTLKEKDKQSFLARKTEILSLTPLRNGQEAMKMENGEMELPV